MREIIRCAPKRGEKGGETKRNRCNPSSAMLSINVPGMLKRDCLYERKNAIPFEYCVSIKVMCFAYLIVIFQITPLWAGMLMATGLSGESVIERVSPLMSSFAAYSFHFPIPR